MNSKRYAAGAVTLALVTTVGAALPAFAQTAAPSVQQNGGWSGRGMGGPRGMRRGPGMMGQGIFGTVSSVSGSTLTVSGRQGFGSSTPATVFSVDASNATVRKNNATSTVADIAVGDMLMIQGSVSGTNVTAKMIRDGVMPMGGMPGKRGFGKGGMASSTSPIQGNGEPVVAGTISSVSGSTITITNKSNVTYTIDATNAKIVKGPNTIAVTGLASGDNVVVQGTVNGTSIVASSVMDQAQPASGSGKGGMMGFFGGIGGFFRHLFGF